MYENGVLHPLEPLLLGERQQVTIAISDKVDKSANHPLLVSDDEWSHAVQDDIRLDDVRRALATSTALFRKPSLKSAESADCPEYFLDASALAKLYRSEAGSAGGRAAAVDSLD